MAKAASAAEINNLFILVSSSHVENAENVVDRRKFLARNAAIWRSGWPCRFAKPLCGRPLRQLANVRRLNHNPAAIHFNRRRSPRGLGGFMLSIRWRLCGRTFSAALVISAALLTGTANAYTPEQQQACSGDAF